MLRFLYYIRKKERKSRGTHDRLQYEKIHRVDKFLTIMSLS